MASIMNTIVTLIVGVIGLSVVAVVVASSQDNLSATAVTVSNFIDVGLAVGLLVLAFSIATGAVGRGR